MTQVNRGYFLVLDGPNGSGKSTQVKLLGDYFKSLGYEVVTTREPGGTNCPGAEAVRDLLVNGPQDRWDVISELLLFAAARRNHVETIIKPALEAGKIVICDRFVPSTIAYQGFGRGASIAMIENITQVAIGNFKPNLTILMFIDPEIGHARAEQRRKGTELRFTSFDADYHARVYTGFMSLITIPDDYYYSLYLPFQVDPKNSIDEVFTNLMLMIKPRLKKSLRLCGDPIFDREDDKNI